MSASDPVERAFDVDDLEPGGLWRCNVCGGLVERNGVYMCRSCTWPATTGRDA